MTCDHDTGSTTDAQPTTVIDLADQLGVEPGDVAVYVDQLIKIDGVNAVVADEGDGRRFNYGVHFGAYNVTLTADAVGSIRRQFVLMGAHELTATHVNDAEHPVAGIWLASIDVMDKEGNTARNVASTTFDGSLDWLEMRDAAERWAESLHFELFCKTVW